MRSKLLVGMVLAATMFSLAGCGVKEKKEVKKNVVSESSDKAREERKEDFLKYQMSSHDTVLTKNCIYTQQVTSDEDEDEEEYCIVVQKNHQGEELNRFEIKTDEEYGKNLVAGSDKRLILTGIKLNKGLIAKNVYWQVPIQQTKEGETLLWEKREEIVSGESFDCDRPNDAQVVEPYMIYHDEKNIVRFNLETGEKRKPALEEDLSEATLSYFGQQDADAIYMRNYPLAAEGKADARHNRDILYRIDIEKWEAEEVYVGADEYCTCTLWAVDGSLMYINYVTKQPIDSEYEEWALNRIECYDREKKQSVGSCTRQDIEQLLDKEHLYGDEKKDREFYIENCFTYAEQVYMVCSMTYDKDKNPDGTYLSDERQVLLSCPMEDMSKLSYEREVSEWWYENTYASKDKYEYGDDDDNEEEGVRVLRLGCLLGGYENEFYFSYKDKENKKWHLMRYDLKSKKQEEIGQKELEYHVLQWGMEDEPEEDSMEWEEACEAYSSHLQSLYEKNKGHRNSFAFCVMDMDGDGVPELIVNHALDVTVYTYQEKLVKVGRHDFESGTTHFMYSDNPAYPGIFVFSVGGGYEWYSYYAIADGKLKSEDLWNEDFSGISEELGKKRDKIEETSSDKELIEASRVAYKEKKEIPFLELKPKNFEELKDIRG